MKKLFAMLALFGAITLGVPSHAEEAPALAGSAPVAQAPVTDAAPVVPAASEAPAAPSMVKSDQLNSGDTAWMIVATALVLFMTIPGLSLFYGGMVRKKNVLATLMQSFAITGLASIIWVVVGYSLAFTPGITVAACFSASSSRLFCNSRIRPPMSSIAPRR